MSEQKDRLLTLPDGSKAQPPSCYSKVECWTLTCSSCGTIAFDDDSSEWAGVAHFDSISQAARTATEDDYGWLVQLDVAYCRRCLERFGCLTEGCQWAEWRDHVSDRYVGRVRSCERCGGHEFDPPIRDRSESP